MDWVFVYSMEWVGEIEEVIKSKLWRRAGGSFSISPKRSYTGGAVNFASAGFWVEFLLLTALFL